MASSSSDGASPAAPAAPIAPAEPAAAESGASSAAPPPTSTLAAAAPDRAKLPSRGVELVAGPDGELAGFSIGPVPQCYAMVEQFLASPRVLAFPTAERYSIAGKVAAVPEEHKRIAERLLAGISSSQT